MRACMNGGNGSAWYFFPVVSSRMVPVERSTDTRSPAVISYEASSHTRMGSPMFIELR